MELPSLLFVHIFLDSMSRISCSSWRLLLWASINQQKADQKAKCCPFVILKKEKRRWRMLLGQPWNDFPISFLIQMSSILQLEWNIKSRSESRSTGSNFDHLSKQLWQKYLNQNKIVKQFCPLELKFLKPQICMHIFLFCRPLKNRGYFFCC